LRFSPALTVVERLLAEQAVVRAYDPRAMAEAAEICPDVRYCSNAVEAAEGADALLLLTEWPEFRDVDFPAMRGSMARALILDGRNLLQPDQMRRMGYEYVGMGRG
jgi:UDPglucose 6-dehydrogenase